jgi:hypothetical protein
MVMPNINLDRLFILSVYKNEKVLSSSVSDTSIVVHTESGTDRWYRQNGKWICYHAMRIEQACEK